MRISIVSAAVAALAFVLPGAASAATTYTFTEYPVPAGAGLRGLAAGPDGALWFGMPRRATVGRMTTTGSVTEYPLPTLPDDTRPDVYDITSGPDGALWYTDYAGDSVGRIATDGTAVRFNLPGYDTRNGASKGPESIVAGPDGNLWFAESTGPALGRITPSGAITEVAIPQPLFDLAVGPDGQLWGTSFGTGDVYRFDTSGNVSGTYHLSTPNSGPRGLASGPDGAMYVVEGPRSKIARITPAGAISEIDGGAAEMFGIASFTDGALYATGPDGGGVDGVNRLSGTTIERAQSPAGTREVVAGPDGALWMTEPDVDKLVRVKPSTPTVTPPPAPRCVVPKLMGATLASAKTKLKKAGCKLGKVKTARSARRLARSKLRVIAQSPAAGKTKPAGTKVNLTLGKKKR